jgi:hypothetical protein
VVEEAQVEEAQAAPPAFPSLLYFDPPRAWPASSGPPAYQASADLLYLGSPQAYQVSLDLLYLDSPVGCPSSRETVFRPDPQAHQASLDLLYLDPPQ